MRQIVVTLALVLFFSTPAAAEPSLPAPKSHAAAWTVAGTGAGFGLGLWAGLTAFDDSINSDRKVWTAAIVSAAAGGVLAYLGGRHKKATRKTGKTGATGATGATQATSVTGVLSDGEIDALAQSVRLTAVSPRADYSALSPSSGETRAARAAGR